MALTKQIIQIPIADGLAQKVDPRRLPRGKAAKALNLVKNKYGRLEKRLGFVPLSNLDFISSTAMTDGVGLGTWNGNLLTYGRMSWSQTNAKVTTLETFSDDLAFQIMRGPVPEVKVATDQVVATATNNAIDTCIAVSGDYMMVAWISTYVNALSTSAPTGALYTAAIEISTGNVVMAPRLVSDDAGAKDIGAVRLFTVGTTFVLVWLITPGGGTPSSIVASLTSVGNLQAGNFWTSIVTLYASTGPAYAFDARAVPGDTTNWILAYQSGSPNTAVIRVEQVTGTTPGNRWTVATGQTTNILGIGIYADTTTNKVAVAYSQKPTTTHQIFAAVGNYPAMTVSSTPTNIYSVSGENQALWLDVAYNGNGIGNLTANTWTVSHTPWTATWNAMTTGNGVAQAAPNRLINSANLAAANNACIIQNQFKESGGGAVAAIANTSGSNALRTFGVVLASRGYAANNILYYLGWVPSATQGSLVVLAMDASANTANVGLGTPMRACGNLQVRTAIPDPAVNHTVHDNINIQLAPNYWTGGSEWWATSPADINATTYVGYFSTVQGQRSCPAYGALQFAAKNDYPTAQYGSLGAIGSALPSLFDGANVFEQGFLWVPESILIVLGSTAGVGPTWNTLTSADTYSWIFTWEQTDAAGNFHISARSTPVTLTGPQIAGAGGSANTYQPTFYIPTLGVTNRQWSSLTDTTHTGRFDFQNFASADHYTAPGQAVTLGVYRTINGGSVFYRIADRYFNGMDPTGNSPVNSLSTGTVTFQDIFSDAAISDGTHPLLYGDGTNGAPGALDNFCPPATQVMVRHKERLFIARGNQVWFTKQRSFGAGPGYNEQVNLISVGGNDPIIAMESMDDKLLVFKNANAMTGVTTTPSIFYITGDGPNDDGSGNSFSPPQPIPTDEGCVSAQSVKSTPDGVYYMSQAGLRRVSRSLTVDFVGGPVEDELFTNPAVRGAILHPSRNRLILAATTSQAAAATGELLVYDYVLDAWTTAVINDNGTQRSPVAIAVANTIRSGVELPVLHFLTSGGVVWRERDPNGATPYFDNATYVSSTWISPFIVSEEQGQGRFRLWDILFWGQSIDPHGLLISSAPTYGVTAQTRTWTWSAGTNLIAPGGVTPLPLTQIRTYDGRFDEAFQITIQDVSDSASVSGQGIQMLGLTCTIGVAKDVVKLPTGSTQ